MDSWVVITVYGRDNTDNRGWLWLSVVSRVGKLHITSRTHVTRSRESMRRAPGLVLLFLCICALSFYVKRTSHYASNSNPRANHTGSEVVDTLILGEYRTFRAGLGLQEVPSNLRLSTPTHSFYAHASPLLADNAIPLPLPRRRIETSSLTSGLDDEPENHVRKMLRRSSTFGLEPSIHSHRRRRGESRNMPVSAHPKQSEIGGGGDGNPPSFSLHFAVDSIREPRTSSEQFLREYALLSAREGNLDNVGATSFTKGGSSNAKPKTPTSPKGKSASANRASARVSSGRRSRGRRRTPSHVEH